MTQAKKLDSETCMNEIKKMIKPAYYIEIQNAIQAQDQEQIERLIYKYLRKDEAQNYFPHILFGLRKLQRNKMKQSIKYLPKPRILEYLKQRLKPQDYSEVWDALEDKNYDLCSSMLMELLRYEEAEEILVHIQRLISGSEHKKSFVEYKKQEVKPNPEQNMIMRAKSMIESEDLFQQVKKQKRESFIQLESQLQNQEVFNLARKYIESGRLKKAEETIRPILGKKSTEAFMKKFKKHFIQKSNSPLENAIFMHTKPDGIRFFEIQTQQIMEIPEDDITNILIVGMTGVGKSTYLNALVNYFMGVDMEDDFRYVVSQDMFKNGNGKSSTDKVMIYGIPKKGIMKKAVRLIDIPGLGDTDGIKKDKTNLKMIKERIQKTVPFINQIIYIFKSSDARITKQTEYVMGQIMGMFAKDMESKILFVLTFADNDEPTVVPQLKLSFGQLITEIQKRTPNWYVKVNNSAMFKKIDLSNHVDVCFYMMGQKCLEQTANIMQASEKVSTKNTVSVMSYRQELQQSVKAFNEIIQASFTQQEEIKKVLKQIALKGEELNQIHYKVKYKQEVIQQQKTDKNVTCCLNCKFPCHKSCVFGSNQEKQKCVAMDKGYCKICPNKCSWKAHINDHKIIKRKYVQVEKTNEDLYKKYQISQQEKNKKQQLILKLITDYSIVVVNIKDYCDRLRTLNQQLSLLQLKKVNHATIVEYVQMMIEQENLQKKQGFKQRVSEYEILKQEEQRLEDILTTDEGSRLNQFQQIMKERIVSLIPNKQLASKTIETVLKAYNQIKIAKDDIKFIRDNEKMLAKAPDAASEVRQKKSNNIINLQASNQKKQNDGQVNKKPDQSAQNMRARSQNKDIKPKLSVQQTHPKVQQQPKPKPESNQKQSQQHPVPQDVGFLHLLYPYLHK